MRISDLLCVPGLPGYMIKDQAAIRAGRATGNGIDLEGEPMTPGFRRILQASEMVSVLLVLEDGQIGHGDCVEVIFAGAAGRDPVFRAAEHLPILEGAVRERLVGRHADDFRALAREMDGLTMDGRPLHTAVRYGLTQALLHAAALATRRTMAEVVAGDYGCEVAAAPVPMLGMCPTDQPQLAEKMMLKRIEALPHANFISAADLGPGGATLLDYADWLSRRIGELAAGDYRPAIHLDVYGGIGALFHMDVDRMAAFIADLAQRAAPYDLMLETPVLAAGREAQMEAFAALRRRLADDGVPVTLIADEWCNTLDDVRAFADADCVDMIQVKTPDLGGIDNTVEALLACRAKGVGAYCGGSANETDQAARVSAHLALACRADLLMVKPGQGVDEGLSIMRNEMARALALARISR